MNEQLFGDYMIVVMAQIEHVIKHHQELVEAHGDHYAFEAFSQAVDTTQALCDLSAAIGGQLTIMDMIVKSCWGLAGLWIDMADDPGFADFIHAGAIRNDIGGRP